MKRIEDCLTVIKQKFIFHDIIFKYKIILITFNSISSIPNILNIESKIFFLDINYFFHTYTIDHRIWYYKWHHFDSHKNIHT
jgi:hypothetical protein